MSDLDRLVADLNEAIKWYAPHNARVAMEEAAATITRLREALTELLSGHDNLYVAYWGPHADPRNDIAAKAARQALGGEHG